VSTTCVNTASLFFSFSSRDDAFVILLWCCLRDIDRLVYNDFVLFDSARSPFKSIA